MLRARYTRRQQAAIVLSPSRNLTHDPLFVKGRLAAPAAITAERRPAGERAARQDPAGQR
jgi:hypothetical protein